MLVTDCVMEAADILCPDKHQLFNNLSLSANTAAECVNDLQEMCSVSVKKSVKTL